MSGKVQGISGNGYFTQAAQGYADGVIQEEKKGNFGGKLAAEYAGGHVWVFRLSGGICPYGTGKNSG